MRFELESFEEKTKRLGVWRNWFAWYPVYLDDTDKPTIVWLETVQRKKYGVTQRWHHRRIPDFDLFI